MVRNHGVSSAQTCVLTWCTNTAHFTPTGGLQPTRSNWTDRRRLSTCPQSFHIMVSFRPLVPVRSACSILCDCGLSRTADPPQPRNGVNRSETFPSCSMHLFQAMPAPGSAATLRGVLSETIGVDQSRAPHNTCTNLHGTRHGISSHSSCSITEHSGCHGQVGPAAVLH